MVMRSFMWWIAGCALILVAAVGFAGGPVNAQGDAVCAAAFLDEMARLSATCSALEPGTICAGAAGVSLLQAATATFAPVAGIASLDGAAGITLTSSAGEPALAVGELPALEEGRSLSGVLWGATRLADAPAPPRAPLCEARSLGSINVRSAPSTQAGILGQLALDQQVPIVARLEDSTWWRIAWDGDFAWVFAELTPSQCDPAIMLVYDPETGAVSGGLPTPEFQAAQIETGLSDPACPAALQGGALFQSPAGGASWLLNGMHLQLDGTIWVQAPPHDVMAVQVLEGQVAVEAGRVSRVASAGQMLRIPLRAGAVDGVPGPVLEGVAAGLESLPLMALPRPIELPAASVTLPEGQTALQCSVLPQQVQVIPDDTGMVAVDLVVEEAQTVRVSAAGAGLTRLAVGDTAAGGEADFRIVPAVALEAGTHRIAASAPAGQPVTLGITCDLPEVTVAEVALNCEDLLLRWDAVQGGSVPFSAPAGARASVVVTHSLPSEGPAVTLAVTGAEGGVLAETGFAGVSGLQVAGPLAVTVSDSGFYRIEWDGDPFNVAAVEVVCELLPPAADTAE